MFFDQPKLAAQPKPWQRRGIARGPVHAVMLARILALVLIAGLVSFTSSAGRSAFPEGQIAPHATSTEAAQSCTACHAGAAEASHPVGFVPSRPLPDAFPLDAEGVMTCSTCHDPNAGTPGLLRAAADGGHICLSCHETAFFADLPDPVRVFMFAGHLDTRGGSIAGIDAFSLRCMVCHTDRGPTTVRTASTSNTLQYDAGSNNHSIGAKYTEATRYGGYESMATLPDEILLPEGRVGCVSCHVPYSREHGRPPHTRNGLCLTCHAL